MQLLTDHRGRKVRLTDERLQHILEHPEMASMQANLAETLREPERVVQSRSDRTALLFYRSYLSTLVGDKWLCVVVKYLKRSAFVLTAYLTDKPKKGKTLWRRK